MHLNNTGSTVVISRHLLQDKIFPGDVRNCLPVAKSRLLLIFSYSLSPDQARQNIAPDLDPKCLHYMVASLLKDFLKIYFKKVNR